MQVAFIISAPREMTLTAGRVETNPVTQEPREDDPPFLNIGRAWGDEFHLNGPLIADLDFLESTLSVSWYLPGEETAEAARPVDLTGAGRFLTVLERTPAEPGWRWRYLLESRRPAQETRFFEGGFLPPLKSSDLTLHLVHIKNFNYDGYILTGLDYHHRPASYIEAEWRQPTLESAGFLED
jgi:hypothetical protein